MILMEVPQHASDMIHYISGFFGNFYFCEIYVNLIWYLYLFMLNKFCLSLSEFVGNWGAEGHLRWQQGHRGDSS